MNDDHNVNLIFELMIESHNFCEQTDGRQPCPKGHYFRVGVIMLPQGQDYNTEFVIEGHACCS